MSKSGILFLALLFSCCFLFIQKVEAQNRPTRVLFILDASGSMAGKWNSGTKMDIAKKILLHLADSLQKEKIPLALRVFGHQSDKSLEDCNDSKLELPLQMNNAKALQSILEKIKPRGYSPIALSLESAVNDFPLSKLEQKPIIILISDGFENCSGDACSAIDKLQKAGIYFRPYIIGLGLSEEQKKQFECVGQLLDVQEKDGLSQSAISEVVITQIMNPTSLQINLLNSNEKATESNVNMSFFNARTGALKYNFYHTLAASGQADSLFIDPAIRYRVKVHTLPSKTLEDVNLTVGNHTIKALETPQGQLKIQMNGNTKAKLIKAIVRQNNKTINAQELNTLQDYLVGSYDIEVLTLPALQFSNIEILQSQTKTITIPNPGILALNKGIGYLMIQKRNDKNQLETIYTMDVALKKESIQLQPGNYEIIYRSKSASSTRASIVKKVTIVSGVASTLNF